EQWSRFQVSFRMCFFFSSRRRHTRWPRDWSSDVCSSDLRERVDVRPIPEVAPVDGGKEVARLREEIAAVGQKGEPHNQQQREQRSEERRVGKEWSPRWSTSQ